MPDQVGHDERSGPGMTRPPIRSGVTRRGSGMTNGLGRHDGSGPVPGASACFLLIISKKF